MREKLSTECLTGVMETLLPVLYARAFETRQDKPIIHDPVAEAWIERIDYNFSQYDEAVLNNLGVAIRTEIFDEKVAKFIKDNPSATIVNVASGLDTRFYRMDNGKITWIELDLPASIAIRRQLMDETIRHRTLEASALETEWMDALATDAPILFIVEGLLMYLTEADIKAMLGALTERFPHAELLLEVIGVSQAKKTHLNDAISKTDAQFKFGIRDASEMGQWHPTLHYIGDSSIYERHQDRWLALNLDWKGKPITYYRDSTDRIVYLRVQKG